MSCWATCRRRRRASCRRAPSAGFSEQRTGAWNKRPRLSKRLSSGGVSSSQTRFAGYLNLRYTLNLNIVEVLLKIRKILLLLGLPFRRSLILSALGDQGVFVSKNEEVHHLLISHFFLFGSWIYHHFIPHELIVNICMRNGSIQPN